MRLSKAETRLTFVLRQAKFLKINNYFTTSHYSTNRFSSDQCIFLYRSSLQFFIPLCKNYGGGNMIAGQKYEEEKLGYPYARPT